MANAHDIKMWNACEKKAQDAGLEIQFKGEVFLFLHTGYGVFPTVESLYYYLCGYEAGYSTGKFKQKD